MKKNVLCLLSTILLSSLSTVWAESKVEMIYADGGKDTIPFSTLQNVIVVNNGGETSLTLNTKNGENITGVGSFFLIGESSNGVTNLSNGQNAITLYPTPVIDQLHIIGAGENPKAMIINANGIIVKETKSSDVEVSSLPEGFYVISVSGKHVRFFKKNK